MNKTVSSFIEGAYKVSRFVLWALLGSIVLTSYIIANTYFDKWWKYRETF